MKKRDINIWLIALYIGAFFCGMTADLGAAVTVKDTGWLWDKDETGSGHGSLGKIYWVEKGSKSYFSRTITFDTGKIKVDLQYQTCNDPAHLKPGIEYHKAGRSLSSLGVWPHKGWYGGGFIDVKVNHRGLEDFKPDISSECSGETGKAVYVWDTPEAKVSMIFSAQAGGDKIALTVDVEPKKEITDVSTEFLCFPSSFALGPDKEFGRDRWISTLKRDVAHDADITLEKDEFWILYYDKIWDVPKAGADGPVALLFDPEQPREVKVKVLNYDITTYFTYPPTARELNYLLWPAMHISNEEALERLKAVMVK